MTVWSHHLRLAVILLAIVKLAGFGVVAAAPTGSLQVVLAAGDDSEPVFDNAAREMSQRLIASGVPANDIHRFSANLAELGSDVEPAYADVLLRRIAICRRKRATSASYS